MTEPSQYFKGRTVQEQMNEVIGYVDVRAEEVAAAKADDVLEPAEQAKTDAIAAKEAAEDAQTAAESARDTTLAALPQIQSDINALDGRLDTVELKVTTAEGNIVTIQGRVTAVETKNSQQDSAIAALQTADGQNVKINAINQYAVGLTGNQGPIAGSKTFSSAITVDRSGIQPGMMLKRSDVHAGAETSNKGITYIQWLDGDNNTIGMINISLLPSGNARMSVSCRNSDGTQKEQVLLTGDVI